MEMKWKWPLQGERTQMNDELDEIREKEEANYRVSLGLLGDSVSLVQDLVDLHKVITETAPQSKAIVKDEHITGLHFLLAVRYHLSTTWCGKPGRAPGLPSMKVRRQSCSWSRRPASGVASTSIRRPPAGRTSRRTTERRARS
jgi:hypothetical protein